MDNILFTGVCTALVTPFLDDRINYPLLEQLLRRQMDAGIKAIVIAGTTGEASTLTDQEKLTLFRKSKEIVGDKCKIIAGTGSNSTRHTVELSIAAQKTGVDGLLVVSPYYNKAMPEGILAHYIAISQAVELPFIVYNVPSRTSTDIPVSVYQRLCRLPNFAGIKEASSDISKVTHIFNDCGPETPVWSGNDHMTVPVISLGGKGVISVLSNLMPVQVRAMAESAIDGDFDTAAFLQISLRKITDLMFCEGNPIPVKEAMRLIGFDCGKCRLPLTSISTQNEKKLVSELSALSLIG